MFGVPHRLDGGLVVSEDGAFSGEGAGRMGVEHYLQLEPGP